MITLALCHALPHADCDDGSWYRYSVATSSGRNSASGYTRGPKSTAYAEARRVLKRLELLEDPQRTWRINPWRPKAVAQLDAQHGA